MSINVTLDGKLMFPSQFLGAGDMGGKDMTVTIAGIEQDELMMEGGKKSKKVVVYLRDTEKKLILNKTNAKTIAGLLGGEMRAWSGKSITLFPTKTKCGRDMVDCVRVRPMLPPQQQEPQAETLSNQTPLDDLLAAIAARIGCDTQRAADCLYELSVAGGHLAADANVSNLAPAKIKAARAAVDAGKFDRFKTQP